MTEDEGELITARLRERFEEHCETLNGLIYQTREEWLGKREGKSTHGKWKSKAAELFDPEIGIEVPHWKEIPYVNKSIEDNLAGDIEFAKELRDTLEQKFAKEQFDLSFTESWGLFCGLIGGLESSLMPITRDFAVQGVRPS